MGLRTLWLPLVASCLVATSCSMLKAGYENLPMLAMWRLGSYVTLDTEQRQLASQRIEALHAWHRGTQLGGYAELLQSIRQRVASGPVDAAQLDRWRAEVLERWAPIVEQAVPAIVDVAATLQPAQLKQLRNELGRANDKHRREWMPPDPAERLQARTRRFVERAEIFLGNLTDSQRRLAQQAAAELPPAIDDLRLAQRVARQQELLQVLERIAGERPATAVAQRWVREHLMRYWRPTDPATRPDLERANAAGDALMVAMLAEATPAQRRHLQRKLQEWIDMAQQLRENRPAAPRQPS